MLPEQVTREVHYVNYWKTPFAKWNLNTWEQFYLEQQPNGSKESLRRALGKELEVLIKYLKPKTRELKKALALSCQLKVSILYVLRNVKILTRIVSVLRPVFAYTGKKSVQPL